MTSYFLDTYAMIEIVKGNKAYEKFSEQELFTCIFNLYEFYFSLLRNFNEEVAKKFFSEFKSKTIEIEDSHIFSASKSKLKHIKKKLSYSDCLGYAIALDYGMRFLTGDNEFKNFENVEFVK